MKVFGGGSGPAPEPPPERRAPPTMAVSTTAMSAAFIQPLRMRSQTA